MAVQPCVRCRNDVAVGSVTCPHCGAEHPHRNRPVAAAAMARKRLVLVGCVVLALLVYVALSFVQTGGAKRTKECALYDAAQARFDKATASGQEPTPDVVVLLDRLRAACDASRH